MNRRINSNILQEMAPNPVYRYSVEPLLTKYSTKVAIAPMRNNMFSIYRALSIVLTLFSLV